MDMEELSKSQIVLLTLLVSFVTSIATGIVTVSLMDQAPPVIAQTVNRVIEHTIERVATSTKGQLATTVVTQEKTVVVKESDLITQALARVNPSIVRLFSASGDSETFLGLGVVLDEKGTILTDAYALGDRASALVQQVDGAKARAWVVRRDEAEGFAFLDAATTTPAGGTIVWTPATLAAGHPGLGEAVVMIAGKTIPRISDGVVTAVMSSHMLDTSVDSAWVLAGSLLIDTNGALVGVSTGVSRASSITGFVSSSALVAAPPKAEKQAQ